MLCGGSERPRPIHKIFANSLDIFVFDFVLTELDP